MLFCTGMEPLFRPRSVIRIAVAFMVALLARGAAVADKDLRYPPDKPLADPSRPGKIEDPGDATVRIWREGLEGRLYYLRSPRPPLLANDAVTIERAKIRFFYPYNDGHTRRRYRVILWFENVPPAPAEKFRLEVEVVETLDDLNNWLATEFSPIPLESDFGWPAEIQKMVRSRFIAEGMDGKMIGLILGGLEYQVEKETLEDGRLREVWLLKNSRMARKAFSARQPVQGALVPDPNERIPGLYLFGSGKPKGLSIVFIDGQVVPPQP